MSLSLLVHLYLLHDSSLTCTRRTSLFVSLARVLNLIHYQKFPCISRQKVNCIGKTSHSFNLTGHFLCWLILTGRLVTSHHHHSAIHHCPVLHKQIICYRAPLIVAWKYFLKIIHGHISSSLSSPRPPLRATCAKPRYSHTHPAARAETHPLISSPDYLRPPRRTYRRTPSKLSQSQTALAFLSQG